MRYEVAFQCSIDTMAIADAPLKDIDSGIGYYPMLSAGPDQVCTIYQRTPDDLNIFPIFTIPTSLLYFPALVNPTAYGPDINPSGTLNYFPTRPHPQGAERAIWHPLLNYHCSEAYLALGLTGVYTFLPDAPCLSNADNVQIYAPAGGFIWFSGVFSDEAITPPAEPPALQIAECANLTPAGNLGTLLDYIYGGIEK